MSDAVWDQFAPAPEVRRDRWGRYLVLPPGGDKPVGYTRATTIAKALDDQSSLIDWAKRTTAVGLAARPDLLALVATTDPDDRKTLNDLCSKASEAGGATQRRDLGTALHSMLERSWFDPTYQPPEPYRADVAAVHQALTDHGLTPMPGMAERLIVNDVLQVAGMFDLGLTDGTTNFIGDVKTGATVNYGALAWAIQLRLYAAANTLYTQGAAADGSLDRRDPMPPFDQERALVIHVQPGSGVCDLHELDLTVGEHGVGLAVAVRNIRKAKPIRRFASRASDSQPALSTHSQPAVESAAPGARVEWLRARITSIIEAGTVPACVDYSVATAGDLMAAWWPDGAPTLREGGHTDDQLEAIAERAAMVEQALGLPFPEPDPTFVADSVRVPADDPRVVELVERLRSLPADLLREVEAGAAAAGITAKVSLGLPLGKLRTLDRIVEEAESAHTVRLEQVDAMVDEFASDVGFDLCRQQMFGDRRTCSADDVARLGLVVEGYALGYLTATEHGFQASADCADRLVVVHGNRRDALNHVKRLAKTHGVPGPKSFVEILDDPLLIAFCIAEGDDIQAPASASA